MSDAKMRMSAYYYGFDATGIPQIDLILSAVACAGKAFHHTESWDDECVWPGHSGTTPQQWIQNAANAAAADLCASRQQVRELEWQRGTRKDDRTAYSDCGVFAVGSDDAGGWFAVHRFIDAEGQVEDKEIGWAETREIAMDDCEHEHRSRILAALTPAPTPLMCTKHLFASNKQVCRYRK